MVALGTEDPQPRDGASVDGVEFRVKDSWKGVSDRSAIIYGQGEGHFGEDAEGYLETDACTATKPLSDAGKDLRVLGPPTTALPDTGGPAQPSRSSALSLAAVVAFVALADILTLRWRMCQES